MFKTKQQFYIYDYIDINVFTDGIIGSLEIALPVFNLSDPITTNHSGTGFFAEIPNCIKFVQINHLKVVGEWELALSYDMEEMLEKLTSKGLNSNQIDLVYEKIVDNFVDKEAMLLPEYNFYVYESLASLNNELSRIKWQSRGKNNV
jgi:hypothetical protein